MSAASNNGEQTYWINGMPFQGIRFEPSNPGEQKYWFSGEPAENIFPLANFDTGKFFLLFE